MSLPPRAGLGSARLGSAQLCLARLGVASRAAGVAGRARGVGCGGAAVRVAGFFLPRVSPFACLPSPAAWGAAVARIPRAGVPRAVGLFWPGIKS